MRKTVLAVTGILFLAAGTASANYIFENFRGHVGLHWGVGQASNQLGSVPTRQLNTMDIQLMPGLRVYDEWMIGPFGEFRLVGQNTKPSDVRDQNLKGNGRLFGVGTRYDFEKFFSSFAVSFLGEYQLNKITNDQRGTELRSPVGVHVLTGYKIWRRFSIDFTGSYLWYRKQVTGSEEIQLEDDYVKHWNIGLGTSYSF